MPKQTIALLDQRLRQLEKNSEKISIRVEKMLTNHLPHIETELVGMKTRINVLTAVNISAIILGIIVSRML